MATTSQVLPTVKVVDEGFEGGFKIINEADFDPEVHTLFKPKLKSTSESDEESSSKTKRTKRKKKKAKKET